MRYFIDTEFIERPGTIDLISIGIVDEDGSEFYAESNEVDWDQCNLWVLENVRPHLLPETFAMSRSEIAEAVLRFAPAKERPEFWGYYADYDWVVFCWLFGTMMDLPDGYPMYCRDLKQWCDSLGNPRLPKQKSGEHHALEDARWNRLAWGYLDEIG